MKNMEDIRNLYMNIYGNTLRSIIEDLDAQLILHENSRVYNDKELKFMKDSILIACEIYNEYNHSNDMYEIMIKYSS